MINVLKSELYTFYSKRYVWVLTLLLFIPIFWFMGNSYKNIYYSLEEELVYIEDAKKAMEEMDSEYDFSGEYHILLDSVSVVSPANAINNMMMLFIGIGSLLLPILFALFIGNEYTHNQMQLKIVNYGPLKVIAAKIIVLTTYVLGITIILAGVGQFIANHHWDAYSATIDKVATYIELPELNTNYMLIVITMVVLLFYSFVGFLIALLARNSIVGIVANVVIAYGEAYILNSSMPKWIFYNWLNKNSVSYESSFVEFAMPAKVAPHGLVISVVLIVIYFILILSGIIASTKRRTS